MNFARDFFFCNFEDLEGCTLFILGDRPLLFTLVEESWLATF